jgi:hypothetical protein
MQQPGLNFARLSDSRTAQQYRAAVFAQLEDGAWHRAKELCARIAGLTDRAVRQIAEESHGEVLSGQLGYRLTKYATRAEANRAEAWLISQGKHMIDRARQIRIARNRRNQGGRAA